MISVCQDSVPGAGLWHSRSVGTANHVSDRADKIFFKKRLLQHALTRSG
jgi:hypothetical protein